MNFIKKILSFIPAMLLAGGLSMAWEKFFALFVSDETFHGFWVFSAIAVVFALHMTTASCKLALGRSLVFAAAMGMLGSIIMMMLQGFEAALPAIVFTVLCFAGSYPLVNYVVKPDPQALEQLASMSKHLHGFPVFYRTTLQEWMHAQETRRKNAVRRQWIGLCFAAPLAALITGAADFYIIPDVTSGDDSIWDWAQFFLWGGSLFTMCAAACMPAWDLKNEMKKRLLEKLTGYFGGLVYHKKLDNFKAEKFEKVGLIRHYNRQQLDDGFTGKYGHVDFILTEIDLSYETGSGKTRRTEYIFDGLMIVMNFPLPFKRRTLVLRDKGRFGNWAQHPGSALERVNLNIKQFEDKFEVYSGDQVEARMLLTPDLMESVIKLGVMFSGKKYDRLSEKDELAAAKGNVEMAFDNSALMITIETGKDLFEIGHLDASMDDTTRIAQFAREVGMIYEIIDTLELNRKAETFAALKA